MIGPYLQGVWRYRGVVALAAVLSAVAGAALAFVSPPQYRASAMLRLIPAQHDSDVSDSEAALEVVEAARIVSEALRDEDTLRKLFAAAAPAEEPAPPARFARTLEIVPVPGTRLLQVGVTLPDPQRAAAIANALTRHAVDEMTARERRRASARREAIDARLMEAGRRLTELEQHRKKRTSEVDRFELDYEAMRLTYTQLARERLELDLSTHVSAEIVRPAAAPSRPVSPSPIQATLFASLAGLAAAALVVFTIVYLRLANARPVSPREDHV